MTDDQLIGRSADEKTRAQVNAFLRSYAASLRTFDAETSAGLWGEPGMVISDEFAGVLDSREEMAAGLQQGYPRYQQLGLADIAHELLGCRAITDKLILADVRWLFYDSQGRLLTEGLYIYLLRRDRDGLRAYTAVAVDEAERINELTRRQAAAALEAKRHAGGAEGSQG